MLEQMIIDADLCIKLGGSEKYPFLLEILPLIAKSIYAFSRIWRSNDPDKCARAIGGFGVKRQGFRSK